jgi:hypothetical protein
MLLETVNAAIKDLQENNQFSVLGLLKGLLTNIILFSIFGLIGRFFSKASLHHKNKESMNLSILIPLLNEEESLQELYNWIIKVMQANNYPMKSSF